VISAVPEDADVLAKKVKKLAWPKSGGKTIANRANNTKAGFELKPFKISTFFTFFSILESFCRGKGSFCLSKISLNWKSAGFYP
jgi:hypothetical protein